MKHLRVVLPLVLILLVAACAPRAVPAAPEVVYQGASADVYATVVRAISTSPGIPGSNGWIIDQSDSAGGFVSARSATSGYRLIGGAYTEVHSISVVVSPNSAEQTAVVIQSTPQAAAVAGRIKTSLAERFGEPISSSQN